MNRTHLFQILRGSLIRRHSGAALLLLLSVGLLNPQLTSGATELSGMQTSSDSIPSQSARADASSVNVLFFLSDDQRHDLMGCAGHPILKTPTMDSLAQKGARFENMFVTTSICAASRATIFTGMYERGHRYTFRTLPLAQELTQKSYPTLFKQAGYRTGFIGKFGVSVQAGEIKEMFDFYRPLNRSPYFKKQDDGSERHITEICADLAEKFLATQDAEQNFCLSISFNAPHAEDGDKQNHFPWPKSVDGMYDDVAIPEPKFSDPEIFEAHPDFLKTSLNRQRFFWRWDTEEKYERNVRAYFRMISGVDHAMGRVLESLEKHGFAENTVVIFTGDNGYYLGQRGFAGKWSHYEESLRTPLIVFDPRTPEANRGQVIEATALNVDLAATFLDLAGIEIPEHYQGQSLVPWIVGNAVEDWRDDFLIEHLMHYPQGIPKYEGVHSNRWVYARYFEQKPVYEYLHDLQEDPNQLTNLARDPSHQEQLQKMRKRCDELRDQLGGEYSLEKFPIRQ